MVRLQKIEVKPNGLTNRSIIYLEKSCLVSISENTEMSTLLETPNSNLVVSTILYSAGSDQRMVDVVGSPEAIYKLFEGIHLESKKEKGLIYG